MDSLKLPMGLIVEVWFDFVGTDSAIFFLNLVYFIKKDDPLRGA